MRLSLRTRQVSERDTWTRSASACSPVAPSTRTIARVAFALAGGERQTHPVVSVTADLVSTQMGNPRPRGAGKTPQLAHPDYQRPATTITALLES